MICCKILALNPKVPFGHLYANMLFILYVCGWKSFEFMKKWAELKINEKKPDLIIFDNIVTVSKDVDKLLKRD